MQKRKHPRLKQYDYSQPGAYFITFCTKNRELLLSGITQPDPYAPAVTRLTEIGRIVEGKLRELPIGISLDEWVIMPNHVHLLVTIEQTSEAKIESEPIRSDGKIKILPCGRKTTFAVIIL